MSARHRVRLATLLVTVPTVIAWGGGATAVADTDAGVPAGGCPRVAADFVPGTWETSVEANPDVAVGMLKPIADALRTQFPDIRIKFLIYPAQAFTGGMAYATSEAAGEAALRADMASLAGCTDTRWLINGYSQGAEIAGNIAASIGCNDDPIPADRVLGVGLIADPKQGNAGGQVVGAPVTGQGIAGARPGGFCGLTSRVAEQCDGKDLYCSTNIGANPILAAVGRMVGQQPSAAGAGALTAALTSNVSARDVAALPADMSTITAQTDGTAQADPATLSAAANQVAGTLQGLGDTASWAKANPVADKQLASAPPNSPDSSAGGLLDTLSQVDIPAAVNNARSIADTAQAISAGGKVPATLLSQPAHDLSSQVSPVTTTPADALDIAGQALSILRPSVVIGQISNAATNALGFAENVPAILDDLRKLFGVVTNPGLLVPGPGQAGLIDQAHTICGDLNNQFAPVVKFAAGADLHLVSGVLRMIPDPTGTAMIASMIIDLLGQVDVVGLANAAGQLQEALWHGIATGDWLGAAGSAASAGLKLVTVGLNTLGGGEKTPISELGDTGATGSTDISSLAGQLVGAVGGQGADGLANIASEGVTAASFLTSGVHQSAYNSIPIDRAGHTAVSWLSAWEVAKVQALT